MSISPFSEEGKTFRNLKAGSYLKDECIFERCGEVFASRTEGRISRGFQRREVSFLPLPPLSRVVKSSDSPILSVQIILSRRVETPHRSSVVVLYTVLVSCDGSLSC